MVKRLWPLRARLLLAAVSLAGLGGMGCLSGLRQSTLDDVKQRLGPNNVVILDDSANFFGLESGSVWQVRGNGCLAATNDAVFFRMWSPRKEIWIARRNIIAVETPKSHLYKTHFHDLLKIRFRNWRGYEDSVAWEVRDLGAWVAVLSPK
jgi:hypothetical protein